MWVQSLGQEDPLEEGMATHSSILAWEISWTEEPGRLWFLGMQSWTRLKRPSPPVGLSYLFFHGASIFQFHGHSHCPYGFWSPRKKKSVVASSFSLSICHEVMGPDVMILDF